MISLLSVMLCSCVVISVYQQLMNLLTDTKAYIVIYKRNFRSLITEIVIQTCSMDATLLKKCGIFLSLPAVNIICFLFTLLCIFVLIKCCFPLCRAQEEASMKDREESIAGQEWEKICRLCDFNPKHSKNTKDVSRMRSILLQLKQTPLVH